VGLAQADDKLGLYTGVVKMNKIRDSP